MVDESFHAKLATCKIIVYNYIAQILYLIFDHQIQCSQNGRCNECNECECFTDINIEGSQYFDPDNYCEDICTATNRCSDCLKNNEVGHCDQCDTAYVYVVNASKSALEERDQGRKVWVHCNVTVDCGLIQTAAMQRDGKKQVMILSGCEAYVGAVRGTGSKYLILFKELGT